MGLYDEEMVPRFVIVRDVGKDEASGRCVFLAMRVFWREMLPRYFCTDSYVGFTESNIRHWTVGEKHHITCCTLFF